jgi:hypothetical protein
MLGLEKILHLGYTHQHWNMTVTMKVKELETTSAIDIYVAILCGLSKTILLMRTSMESFVKQVAKAKRMCTIHVNF